MIQYWSRTLIPTSREAPSDAEAPSHRLMLRAGLIRKLGAGVYTYLPAGLRSLQKAMQIVRDEMNAAGACEVLMPTLQPVELWERTGRRATYGDNLFVVKDRHGREQALGPTHEEVITELVAGYIESYRQLPITLYQIQTKFRDEFRPRFGVLRSREFQMKDAYSFDVDIDGLNRSYDIMYDAYCRIFSRCGIPYEIVEAEAGPIGGNASHEFMSPSPTGEDTILKSDKGNYAANVEKCAIGERTYDLAGAATGDLEEVSTPDCPGIEDVAAFFKKQLKTKLKTANMLKSLLFVVTKRSDVDKKQPWYVLAVVRGDHDGNEAKVREAAGKQLGEPVDIELAPEATARADGWALGFVGPHAVIGRDDTLLLVDHGAAAGGFWVAGANKADHHVKHFNWQRDVVESLGADKVIIADVRNAAAGDPSPKNDGGVLEETKGIEIGHVFKLGTKYTAALDAMTSDESNERSPIIMGCYGIGVNRILAAAIECQDGDRRGHDDDGIIWPAAIAPWQVLITPIKYAGDVKDAVDKLAAELEAAGLAGEVLIDDREERPGVKFKDADLVGFPVRVTIGDKGLADGKVEVKARNGINGPKGELIDVAAAQGRIVELLKTL